MNHPVKVAVIGGTGKSGRYLVTELIKQGYPIKLLLRNPGSAPDPHPLIEIVHGNVADQQSVRNALSGCTAVVSTLGLGIPPSEPELFSKATAHILHVMNLLNIQRYIVTTGLHVDTPSDRKSKQTAAATAWMQQHYPVSTASKQQEYALLERSSAAWTLIRLPLIEQTDRTFPLRVSLEDCPGDKISATDLAQFIIRQLGENGYIRQAPFIANV